MEENKEKIHIIFCKGNIRIADNFSNGSRLTC